MQFSREYYLFIIDSRPPPRPLKRAPDPPPQRAPDRPIRIYTD